MQITIIGHKIQIHNLDDFDYRDNDSFIYKINDAILEGNDEGLVVINNVSYNWGIIQNIDPDKYENICFENKMMANFLQNLGLTPEDITSVVINGSNKDINSMLLRIKQR
jgi:hypothetical protein